jgi:hypothetical protein
MATADPKLAWLREALGVAIGNDAGAGQRKEGKEPEKDAKGGVRAAIGGAIGRIGGAIGEGGEALGGRVGDAIAGVGDAVADLGEDVYTPEVKEVQAHLDREVKGLEALGLDTKQLKADKADQERALTEAAKMADKDQREAALKRARKRMQELDAHAEALAKATKKVMGDTKGAPNAMQKAAIYQKALEDHYNLKITVPEGMSNTHMDRVYDMMGTVPKKQAKQRKLKKLTYTSDDSSGAYGNAEVEMGDFGDATGTENYEIDGKTIPANSFDVTMLHEMGHALDDRHGIMAKHMAKPACGGWRTESKESVADALLAFFKKKVKVGKEIDDKAARDAIVAALSGTTPTAPAGAKDSDWQKVIAFLADYPAKVIGSYKPWFKAAVDVDGRAYIQSYSSRWNSYVVASRATTKVNDYQWRAPGEWFAEVYAISWLSKKKPPAAVDAAIADHCWKP